MTNEIEGIDNEVKKRTEQMLAEKSAHNQIMILKGIRTLFVAKRELEFKLMKQ